MEKNTFYFCCSFVSEGYYLFLVNLFIFIRANLYGKKSQENILYFMLCSRIFIIHLNNIDMCVLEEKMNVRIKLKNETYKK